MTIDSANGSIEPTFVLLTLQICNSGVAWSTGGTSGNNFTPIPFDREVIDRTNSFDPSTFKFTVPVAVCDYLFYFWGISGL